ncbi:MAG: DUF3037 domain-containing protein [Solirubrobacteraceae bacterium]
MPDSASPFTYAVLRLVPRVERGERINVGVVLFCRQAQGFLGVRSALDSARVGALDSELDLDAVRMHLEALEHVAAGDPRGGALAALEPSERFGWLVAPSSTMIQPSEVHTGLCTDPAAELEQLFKKLVG